MLHMLMIFMCEFPLEKGMKNHWEIENFGVFLLI